MYDRGQCGSTTDIMALSSDQAVMTIDIARGRLDLALVMATLFTYLQSK